ncbi:IS630 transposase-related protein [Thermosynechococcaceae cyanobacterium BACA0444]|uniref:IS630 transposase-related protein n=1 Tax=Pseudocalidococcus azoricus BACA0444 TaxID=2918990 RepID=A0AAE4FNK3_9CYAN|nr:IS630 transposase-related protein [Pseudocalidococcus azoricus]MDS3859265.1 IS630 transposase-related protein [Pseudocalidococcus azoricus BACA0444]MDS3859496.1 IS630 transposase-related protein [Pseudocalidococcus azoricus BACA0444]
MSYSEDLRKKALEAVARGAVKAQLCKTLNISRNTLDSWIKRYVETGSYTPPSYHHQRRKPKIDNLDKFREFVLENNDKTQQQLADLWGHNITQQDVSRALQKLNITPKKRPTPMQKKMKTNAINLRLS